MRIGIAIPTIPGREDSLARAIASHEATEGIEVVFSVWENSPSSGTGWKNAAGQLASGYDLDYLHLTNDDCEAKGPNWWCDAVEACDAGKIPAPVVYNTDGSLQSAGGDMTAPANLLQEIEDWREVGFTTIPFLSWSQWEQIGMRDLHYCSDVWVSERGKQLGFPTVLRTGYEIVHHMSQIGRTGDASHDHARMQSFLG